MTLILAFLGYAPKQDELIDSSTPAYMGSFLKYPHAKIAEFGLAEIVTFSGGMNVAALQTSGAYLWKPPVSSQLLERHELTVPHIGGENLQDGRWLQLLSLRSHLLRQFWNSPSAAKYHG